MECHNFGLAFRSPVILPAKPPFSLSTLVRVLQRFPHHFAERVRRHGSIERLVVTSEPVRVELFTQDDLLRLEGTSDPAVRAVISEVFELNSDVRQRLQAHPQSHILGEALSLPILRWEESFAAMASTIIEQQNSWVSATRCIHSLFHRGQRRVGTLGAFPQPVEVLANPELIRDLSITNKRKALILALAEEMRDTPAYLDRLCSELDQAETQLCRLKGIGPWTARVFLSKRFGYRPRVPTNDVALQRAAAHFILNQNKKMDPKELSDRLGVFQELAGEAAQRLLLRWVLETYPAN